MIDDDTILLFLGLILACLFTLFVHFVFNYEEKECVDYYLKNDYVLSYCEEYIET